MRQQRNKKETLSSLLRKVASNNSQTLKKRLKAIDQEIAELQQLRAEVESYQHDLTNCQPDAHEPFRILCLPASSPCFIERFHLERTQNVAMMYPCKTKNEFQYVFLLTYSMPSDNGCHPASSDSSFSWLLVRHRRMRVVVEWWRGKNMKREKVLLCFICLLLLAACGSNASKSSGNASSTRSGNTPTPNPVAPPGNFLYSGATEAIFLAWVNTSGSLSGQTQDARLQSNNHGSEQVKSTHGSFTGVLTNGQVSLNFGGFLGWSYNVTGTYNGTTLLLNLPTQDGSIGSFPFVPATSTDFNNAVSALQTTAGNDNATVTAAQDQATAHANATMTTYSQQRAVANANYNLGNALSQLNSDANALASFSETDTLNSYANTWKTMQNDYTTEQNDAQAGCGDNASNYYHVQSDAYQVNSDEYQMNSDDYQLSSDKNQYESDMSAVQNDIQAVQNDWAKLQQAVANNPTNIPTAAYTSGDVNKAIQNAQNAEKTAQGVWQSAQSSASQYDQKASNLNSQAQALPEKMGC